MAVAGWPRRFFVRIETYGYTSPHQALRYPTSPLPSTPRLQTICSELRTNSAGLSGIRWVRPKTPGGRRAFPPALVREVEQRRKSEAESPAPAVQAAHPIAYLTLGELVDSILEEANWEQVFRVRLGMSRDAFTQIAAALTAVRNKVAHNRPISISDLDVLHLALNRLF